VETPNAAELVASRLVEALAAPVDIAGAPVDVSASVGLAFRADDEDLSVDSLLHRADVAMYHAKARGKNRWATYAPAMDVDERVAPSNIRRSAPAA
jgi:GGDEF domain-containing protein